MSTAKKRILIIGGGPCGLGAAYRAQELIDAGHDTHDYTLVDSSTHTGGLASTLTDPQGFLWDIGGHVIFSHYAYFSRLLDLLIPQNEWNCLQREAWVWMLDRFVPYPFQQNLHRLPTEQQLACIDGLIDIESRRSSFQKPQNFKEWLLQSFGSGLCDVFMFPYNYKVWAYNPDKMNVEWMGERVATVDTKRVIKNILLKKDEVGWGPNSLFRFPLHGGTGAIWERLTKILPQEKIKCNKKVVRVDAEKKVVEFEDGSVERYDALISTIPINNLMRITQNTSLSKETLENAANKCKYSSTHVIGFGIEGSPPEHLKTKCWMYFPESNCPFYRCTVFSNYSKFVCPKPGEQWSIMCEVSESTDKPVNVGRIVEETERGLLNTKLISPTDRIVSRFHTRLEFGYPTPFVGRDGLLNPIHHEFAKHDIYSRGRFGCWKYEVSNQDHSLMLGVETIDHILFGTEEITFKYAGIVNEKRDNEGRLPLKWNQMQKMTKMNGVKH